MVPYSRMKLGLLLGLSLATAGQAFYIPGIYCHQTSEDALLQFTHLFSLSSGWSEKTYANGDKIKLQLNKITSDSTELPYSYAQLPFICKPKTGAKHLGLNLGEVLRGDRIVDSDYELLMGKNEPCKYLCDINIGRDEVMKAQDLIHHNYVVEWYVS